MRISDWSSDVCFSDLLASDDQRICRLGTLLPRDRAAAAHGLSVKVHAEQLSNSHGAALAARYGALSADHLEHQIGRASCRDRVFPYVSISLVDGSLTKK